jgi:hypothetical protein
MLTFMMFHRIKVKTFQYSRYLRPKLQKRHYWFESNLVGLQLFYKSVGQLMIVSHKIWNRIIIKFKEEKTELLFSVNL